MPAAVTDALLFLSAALPARPSFFGFDGRRDWRLSSDPGVRSGRAAPGLPLELSLLRLSSCFPRPPVPPAAARRPHRHDILEGGAALRKARSIRPPLAREEGSPLRRCEGDRGKRRLTGPKMAGCGSSVPAASSGIGACLCRGCPSRQTSYRAGSRLADRDMAVLRFARKDPPALQSRRRGWQP